MSNYQFYFDKLSRKSIRRIRKYKINSRISIYQAEEKFEEIQRNLTSQTTISVLFDNGINEFEIEKISIDPLNEKLELLDVIQSQLIDVKSEKVNGSQIYMEINRQYNEELKSKSSLKIKKRR